MDVDWIGQRAGALGKLTQLEVRALDDQGACLDARGACEYCRIFQKFLPAGESCQKLHAQAGRRARDIGEAYLFSCHAGVCHIVLALEKGAVLVGPFLLGELDASVLQEVGRHYPIPSGALLDMFEAAMALRVLSTQEAGALLQLMGFLFDPAQEGAGEARRRGQQQQRISESIQMYKGFQGAPPAYPYEKERELIEQVRAGDPQKAGEVLNDLLGYTLFSTGGELETIKSWTAELCALLSRAAIECGVQADDALRLNHAFMRSLWEAATLEDLCDFMQEAVERFCESVFPSAGTGERAMVARAIRYVRLHYAEGLTLCDVAREAHLSESYFSSVFKRVTGTSLRAYISAVRVEEAKRLLSQDDLIVTEVAMRTGFESQSYFSKVFHRTTGMTPKEYRKKLHVCRND